MKQTTCQKMRHLAVSSPCGIRPCAVTRCRHQPHLRFRRLGSFPVVRMEAAGASPSPHRLAVVTDGNGTKPTGLEVCRQLALQGVRVILAANNEKRGNKAVKSLINHGSNLSNIIFHRLDIHEHDSVSSLAQHIESQYGKLDILVNNAGADGILVNQNGLRFRDPRIDALLTYLAGRWAKKLKSVSGQLFDASRCFRTNYYGCQRVTKAMLPLLKRSTSGARIVNISFVRPAGLKKRMPNAELRDKLHDADAWDEDRIDGMLEEFLDAMRVKRLEEEGWPTTRTMTKIAVNLYTSILARRHPEMRVNCMHTSDVVVPPEVDAREAVKLALLPDDGLTGSYIDLTEPGDLWW